MVRRNKNISKETNEENKNVVIIPDDAESEDYIAVVEQIKLSKELKEQYLKVPVETQELRDLADIYKQVQQTRIDIEGKLRALSQQKDGSNNSATERSFMAHTWAYKNAVIYENNMKKIIDAATNNGYLATYAKSVTGIGPVFSAALVSRLKLEEDRFGSCYMHAGNWCSYCGLNDNNRPWLGKANATKIVKEIIDDNDGKITTEVVAKIAEATQWNMEHLYTHACIKGKWNKEKLIKAASMPPYNIGLKSYCYLIGKSFQKLQNNPKSLYGKLYRERYFYELQKNERGDYAEAAKADLEKKKYSKDTESYKSAIQGKFSDSHIKQRACRYATKIFISHLFEAAYYNKYGVMPPEPYVLSYGDHTDYIKPEIPYDSIPRDLAF